MNGSDFLKFVPTLITSETLADYLNLSNTIALVAAVVANSLIISLAFIIRNTDIRAYKWYIAMQSLIELTYTIALYALKPRYYCVNDRLRMIITGPAVLLPNVAVIVALTLTEGLQMLITITFSIAFIHQYWQICCEPIKHSLRFTLTTLCAIVVICVVVAINMRAVYASIVRVTYIPNLGYTVTTKIENKHNWLMRTTLFVATTVAAYLIAAFCGISSFRRISKTSRSETSKRLQKRFTILITLQALLPFLFHTLPAAGAYIWMYRQCETMDDMLLVYIALDMWGACMHPILCFAFLRPFVKAFTQIIHQISTRVRQLLKGVVHGDKNKAIKIKIAPAGVGRMNQTTNTLHFS